MFYDTKLKKTSIHYLVRLENTMYVNGLWIKIDHVQL